jgi:hypothetical protein
MAKSAPGSATKKTKLPTYKRTSIQSYARSTRDLLNILDAVAKAGAGFKSLHDPYWRDIQMRRA